MTYVRGEIRTKDKEKWDGDLHRKMVIHTQKQKFCYVCNKQHIGDEYHYLFNVYFLVKGTKNLLTILYLIFYGADVTLVKTSFDEKNSFIRNSNDNAFHPGL